MSPEEMKLRSEIARLNTLMVVFAVVALIVGLFMLFRFLSYSETPEDGFAGMLWMFGWFLWVPLILFPIVGVFIAWTQKQKLTARLSASEKNDDDTPGA
jgi:hypothetical protein